MESNQNDHHEGDIGGFDIAHIEVDELELNMVSKDNDESARAGQDHD